VGTGSPGAGLVAPQLAQFVRGRRLEIHELPAEPTSSR
jgi:hypothetical protein